MRKMARPVQIIMVVATAIFILLEMGEIGCWLSSAFVTGC